MIVTPVASSIGGGTINAATTPPIDTTGANLIVIAVSCSPAGAIPAITDSRGNVWRQLTPHSGLTLRLVLLYCAGRPRVGPGHTFTATGSVSLPCLYAGAFAHAARYPLDGQSGNATLTPGALTPSVDGCLVLTACSGFDQTPTLGAPWAVTSLAAAGGFHRALCVGVIFQEAAEAEDPTWVCDSVDFSSAMAVWLPVSPPAPGPALPYSTVGDLRRGEVSVIPLRDRPFGAQPQIPRQQ